MKISIYLSVAADGKTKGREEAIGSALKAGFERHGDTVAMLATHEFVRPDWESQLAVVIGIKGHSKRIFEAYRRGGRHAMLVDKSYLGRTEYMRLSVDGFQPAYAHAVPRPHDRWERIRKRFGIEVKPRVKGGEYAIYAGSSQKYCDWHGLGDATEFAISACHSINKQTHSALPLLYRPKPSWVAMHPQDAKPILHTTFSGPDVKLGALLPRCQALVTHGSNAAVEAIIAGVPAIVISRGKGASAAELVAETAIEKILEPHFPSDKERVQWLANLAYLQFDMEEIANGTAWELTAPFTMKAGLQSWAGLNSRDSVIAQYRAMHESPKMFRGGSMKGHVEALTDLVDKHKPKTLLDFGSGKGAQYDEMNLHEFWGGPKPQCYDPGVPGLDVLPTTSFDGVICTDVAEHWAPETVADELKTVLSLPRKFAFFCIFTEPSRKFLPDGRNAHLTCRPEKWWLARICEASGGEVTGSFNISKPIPGGGYEVFPHATIEAGALQIVVTFRGQD